MEIKRNWDRLAELTRKPTKTVRDKAEINYRADIQNHYSAHGRMPDDYIPVEAV